MTQHNRNRNAFRSDDSFAEQSDNPRYPGAGSGEFSQLGGPHPGSYRESTSGETGWNPTGGRQYGNQSQQDRGYAQGGDYRGQGGYSGGYGEQGGYGGQQYGGSSSQENFERPYQGGEGYGSQRGGYGRSQPTGYPDYSSPQDRGGRYQNQGGYASQDRGNIDSPMDRDWSQYSGNRSGNPSQRSDFGGGQAGYYGGMGRSYAGQGGYSNQGGYGGGQGGYSSQGGYGPGGQSGYSGNQGGYAGGYAGNQGGYGGQGGYSGQGGFPGQGYGAGQRSSRQGSFSGGGQTAFEERTRRQGPKGYQRSDERLREQVIDRLMSDSNVDLQEIEVDVKEGVVILSGTAESRQCRHELEDLADSVWGVKEVTNNIRVRSADQRSSRETEVKPGSDRSSSMGGSSSSTSSTGSSQRESSGSTQTTGRNR